MKISKKSEYSMFFTRTFHTHQDQKSPATEQIHRSSGDRLKIYAIAPITGKCQLEKAKTLEQKRQNICLIFDV